MLLDYSFNSKRGQFVVSYTTQSGGKQLIKYNVSRFKTYIEKEGGQFLNWNGKRCEEAWSDQPGRLGFLTFLKELPPGDRQRIFGTKTTPQLYAFDIEVECGDEFPEPSVAKWPILTISVVNAKLDCLVLGTKVLEDPENTLQESYREYLKGSQFYVGLGMSEPRVHYIYFENEGDMIDYFLQNIVQKAPILTGWNVLGFDWSYICNRIKEYFPELSINKASSIWQMTRQGFRDFRGDKHELTVPCHTTILDMMDIIDTDFVVMPQKENLSLDYIASESPVGLHKIQYDGDLQKLYENDYAKYVFYNAIDSALVQLIDKAFGTLGNFEMQAQYCGCKISDALSKIKLTETLFFNYFYENDIKIGKMEMFSGDRGKLLGAYVREPTPGKHRYVCCNDFASLYPSAIITCNLSVENYIGNIEDGDFTEDDMKRMKEDPRFFVSVNGSAYKNDKDYSFKIIQKNLKSERSISKYLSKQLDAGPMMDIEHSMNGRSVSGEYKENVIGALREIGYAVVCGEDIKKMDKVTLNQFRNDLQNEIRYLSAREQAIKILMNSMYGGSSHVAFMFFNIRLANDITGEARNLIHMMESHIPKWFEDNWLISNELHEKLGVKLKENATKDKAFVKLVYGDTDSLYISYEGLLETISGREEWTKTENCRFLVDLNEKFLNDHNKEYIKEYYLGRHCRESVHEFELETVNFAGIWLNVKKRYAQILLWKDGKYYDEDNLPLKVKGLEIVKSSYPKFARGLIKGIVMEMITRDDKNLVHILNQKVQEAKRKYLDAPLEAITPSSSVNNYFKYVLDDSTTKNLKFALKAPANVKGLAMYNAIRQENNLPGEPIYNGKLRWYIIKSMSMSKNRDDLRFCYRPGELPKWAEEYAPVNRNLMFQQMVLDPINRMLEPCGFPVLSLSGEIQFDMFSLWGLQQS